MNTTHAKMLPSEIQERLQSLAEDAYRTFSVSLNPQIDPETVLGVRVPHLRQLAKEIARTGADEFLATLPHRYFEENNLHVFLISAIPDFAKCMEETERFLPYVDNWATCDSLRPGVFAKERVHLRPYIDRWLDTPHPYTVRFAIEMLMVHFLDDAFLPNDLQRVATIQSEHYYVNMMIAWYFATALAKQPEKTLPYIEKRQLDAWVHRKTIQKAVESYRVPAELKVYLKMLRH